MVEYFKRIKVFPGIKCTLEYFCSSFPVQIGMAGKLILDGAAGTEYFFPVFREEWEARKNEERVIYYSDLD